MQNIEPGLLQVQSSGHSMDKTRLEERKRSTREHNMVIPGLGTLKDKMEIDKRKVLILIVCLWLATETGNK